MIDFHAHLGKVIHGQPPLTSEDLVRSMDRHGIERSVVLLLVAPEEEDYYYTTEQALADCARYPDRLIPFANMDPRRGANDGSYDFYPVLKADKKGYPKRPVKVPGTVERLLAEYPNMYADLSAMSAYNALSRDLAAAKRLLETHHRKLLFGTDWFVRQQEPRVLDLVRKLGLSAAAEEAIFASNAKRLLRL